MSIKKADKYYLLACDFCGDSGGDLYAKQITARMKARRLGWEITSNGNVHKCPRCLIAKETDRRTVF